MSLLTRIKEYIIFFIFIAMIIGMAYYVVNFFSYFDPGSLCYIKTEKDILRGNEETIKQALRLIKLEDKEEYKMICAYVDVISEKDCVIADHHIDPNKFEEGWEKAGCYVKGSKTIYLKPNNNEGAATVKKRAEDIKKYAEFSKEFWE